MTSEGVQKQITFIVVLFTKQTFVYHLRHTSADTSSRHVYTATQSSTHKEEREREKETHARLLQRHPK